MSMWGALEDTRRDADRDYDDYIEASRATYGRYRSLGIVVVIVTTIVGTSVFSALTNNNPNLYIQIGTAVLSIAAAVLSSVQTFYGFEENSRKQLDYAIECYAIKRAIDVFFTTYPERPTDYSSQASCDAAQTAINDKFTEAKRKAPILPTPKKNSN